MKNDNLKTFVETRDKIIVERDELAKRLEEINTALGQMGIGRNGGGPRARNEKSLKETVLEVLGNKEMSKHEILDAVAKAGYIFSTENPENSLGVILYSKNNKIKNNKGKFSISK